MAASCKARVTVEKRKSDGAIIASELYAKYPLRLHICQFHDQVSAATTITTRNAPVGGEKKMVDDTDACSKGLSIFLLSHGGGLLAGDSIMLDVLVKEGAAICATSFSMGKAFKPKVLSFESPPNGVGVGMNDANLIRTHSTCRVGKNALLALCPQPTQCFRNTCLEQKNFITIEPDGSSSLMLVDWYTGGRANLDGGIWQMDSLHSSTEIFLRSEGDHHGAVDKKIFWDVAKLKGGHELSRHMRGFNVVAMVILIGDRVKQEADSLMKACCARSKFEMSDEVGKNVTYGREGMNTNGLLVSCGKIDIAKDVDQGVLLRLSSHSVEQAGE